MAWLVSSTYFFLLPWTVSSSFLLSVDCNQSVFFCHYWSFLISVWKCWVWKCCFLGPKLWSLHKGFLIFTSPGVPFLTFSLSFHVVLLVKFMKNVWSAWGGRREEDRTHVTSFNAHLAYFCFFFYIVTCWIVTSQKLSVKLSAPCFFFKCMIWDYDNFPLLSF